MKKFLLFILRISVSAGILFYIFTRPDVNIREIGTAFKNIDLRWLFTGWVTYFLVLLVGTLRWKTLLVSHGIKVGFKETLEYNFIGYFFNNMMPSLTGGDVIKAFYVARDTTKKAEAVATIVVDRFLGLFAMLVLALFGSLMSLGNEKMLVPSLAVIGMFVLISIGIALFINRKIMSKINIFKLTKRKFAIEAKIKKIYEAFVYYRNDKKNFFIALGLAIIVQTLMILLNYSIATGLGLSGVSIWQFFIFIPIANIISAIPVSFAGWGIGEGAYKLLFSLSASPQAGLSVGLSIIVRLIMLSYSLCVGLPVYLLNRPKEIKTIN
ncbi:MAG: lysylphosphatidylglycerol synthase transmembrane domain-containing protein [Candidatus Theseobacter exili]|nr:lysylphosphatidylglycerol synthase transmembrane domain-containing protein [Candidatus Theseobacter exili]